MTLVVVLRSGDVRELLALKTALTSIPKVTALAVSSSGDVTALADLPIDRLGVVAESEVEFL